MIDNLKKYWWLYTVLSGAALWLATIDSKTFDSAEQKVEVTKFVEESPGAKEQWEKHLRDSMNTVHAMKERVKRTRQQFVSDSIHRHRDSLTFDMIQRQTIQLEQVKEELKKIKDD